MIKMWEGEGEMGRSGRDEDRRTRETNRRRKKGKGGEENWVGNVLAAAGRVKTLICKFDYK